MAFYRHCMSYWAVIFSLNEAWYVYGVLLAETEMFSEDVRHRASRQGLSSTRESLSLSWRFPVWVCACASAPSPSPHPPSPQHACICTSLPDSTLTRSFAGHPCSVCFHLVWNATRHLLTCFVFWGGNVLYKSRVYVYWVMCDCWIPFPLKSGGIFNT